MYISLRYYIMLEILYNIIIDYYYYILYYATMIFLFRFLPLLLFVWHVIGAGEIVSSAVVYAISEAKNKTIHYAVIFQVV